MIKITPAHTIPHKPVQYSYLLFASGAGGRDVAVARPVFCVDDPDSRLEVVPCLQDASLFRKPGSSNAHHQPPYFVLVSNIARLDDARAESLEFVSIFTCLASIKNRKEYIWSKFPFRHHHNKP